MSQRLLRRPEYFQFRMSTAEKRNLEAAAASAKKTVSGYIRDELCRSAIPRSVKKAAPGVIADRLRLRTAQLARMMPETQARRQAMREMVEEE